MVFDKLKKLAEEAAEKAGPLAKQAKEKAGPLAAQAKEKAADLASKAAPVVAHGVDIAADKLDSATKGKYSDKIDVVQDKIHDAADKVAGTDSSQTTEAQADAPATGTPTAGGPAAAPAANPNTPDSPTAAEVIDTPIVG